MEFPRKDFGENLARELRRILQEVQITSPTSFIFGGRPVVVSRAEVPPISSVLPQQNPLVMQLQRYLYQYCYCTRFTPGQMDGPLPAAPLEDKFLGKLSEANSSTARWESGWRIQRVEAGGQVWLERHGVQRIFWPGEFITGEIPGAPPKPGMHASVFFPKESTTLLPGSYFAFGETVLGHDVYDLVRFYWNIDADGVLILIRSLTGKLNHFQVPFRLKCPIRRELFSRFDSAVVYVNKQFYHIVYELLMDSYEPLKAHLRPEIPLFTFPLAPGLSLAEDPGNWESFGMNRCRIVAEAIWQAHTKKVDSVETELQELITQFRKYGLVLDKAYLNAGSVDQYDVASPS